MKVKKGRKWKSKYNDSRVKDNNIKSTIQEMFLINSRMSVGY